MIAPHPLRVAHRDRGVGQDEFVVAGVSAVPLRVPLTPPHHTSRGVKLHSSLVAVELLLTSGVTGKAVASLPEDPALHLAAELRRLGETFTGRSLPHLESALSARRQSPVVRHAAAVLDIAAWDAQARLADVPLYRLLGGKAPSLHVLGVVGRRGLEGTVDGALALVEQGMGGIKLEMGYPVVEQDLAVLRAVRREVGPGVELMVEYNQSLTGSEARERTRALEDLGLAWIEEPVRWDDFLTLRHLVADLKTTIQVGENFQTGADVRAALDIVGSEALMLDVQAIGGVTKWLKQSRVAAQRGVPVSTHLWPELSAHLLAATDRPGWLEWTDWWTPLAQPVLSFRDGLAHLDEAPGSGVEWDRRSLERFRF